MPIEERIISGSRSSFDPTDETVNNAVSTVVDRDLANDIDSNTNKEELDAAIAGVGGIGSVPYTGATEDLDLGIHNLMAQTVQVSGGAGTEGTLAWNTVDGTLDLDMAGGNATLQIGQEMFYHIKAGEAITDGDVVYASGTNGASGKIIASKYLADGNTKGFLILGIATESIASGLEGYITAFGKVRGINTSSFAEGSVLYPSSTVAGGLTSTAPISPNIAMPIAFAVNSAINGAISVRLTPPNELAELHDVHLTTPVEEGDLLVYNATTGHWDNQPLPITGVDGALLIEHTAIAADDHALEIILDAAGFGDVKALDIDYITGNISTGEDEGIILVNIDESLSTGGTVVGLEVIATTVGGATVDGMLTGVGVNPIKQLAGSFGNAASVLNNATNVLTAVSVGGAGNISTFSANSDTVTIGFGTKFEELEIILDTQSSKSIDPTFEYSTGIGTWGTFTPVDGTNGFQNTGVVIWLDSDIPTFAAGLAGEYLIRITRTKVSITTTPIVDLIQASSVTEHQWDENGNVHVETLNAKSLKLTITPSYADDTAAGVGGLTIGQVYQTSGAGAAPLNAAGILMIKQ